LASITQFEDPNYLEAVYDALFQKLKTATFAGTLKLQTTQRAVEAPSNIQPELQPALVLINGPIHVEQKEFGLAKWTITAVAAVYIWAEGASVLDQLQLPATMANRVVWGFAQAIQPPNTPQMYGKQDLGGIVEHCWIEGAVLTEVQAQQIVVTVPIMMLAGPNR